MEDSEGMVYKESWTGIQTNVETPRQPSVKLIVWCWDVSWV